jgi:hypothetical protein
MRSVQRNQSSGIAAGNAAENARPLRRVNVDHIRYLAQDLRAVNLKYIEDRRKHADSNI